MKLFNNALWTTLALIPALGMAALPNAFDTSIPVEHIYSPAGFDTNDNAEVAITGYLPNLCYKAPKSVVTVKDGKIAVAMKATRKDNGLAFCVNIRIPYVEYVKIGVLDKGPYVVAVNEATQWEKYSKLSVVESRNNANEEIVYANVDKVVRADEDSRKVLLQGYNPSDCFELKDIVVKDNGVDTYSILPRMKQVRAHCPKKMVPFTYEVEVPQNLEADKVLLHVRVMDGRSVNAFFNNKPIFK